MKTCSNVNCNKKRELKLKRKMKMCEHDNDYEDTYHSGNEYDNNHIGKTHRYTYSKLSLDDNNNNNNCKGLFHTVTSLNGGKKSKQYINICPGGKMCKNYKYIIDLQYKIQKLMRTVNELTKVNEYFKFSLLQKDRMYKMLLNNDKQQQQQHSKSSEKAYSHRKSISSYKMKNPYETIIKHDININTETIPLPPPSSPETKQQQQHHHTYYNNKQRSRNTYEKLMEMTTRSQKHNLQNSSGVSFLALPDERLRQLINNPSLNNLYRLTLSDEGFLNEFKSANSDTLLSYCYIINSITKDYQTTLNLILRIKHFMECSIDLTQSLFHSNAIKTFITNINRILNTETTSIILHDAFTDMLIEHTLTHKQTLNIHNKENEIIKTVFTRGEKVKIDDITNDNRFKIHLYTNKIRNIICYPLIDYDGDIFGVVQSINKRHEYFDNNDEEILTCYVQQLSCILKQIIEINDSNNQINKLKEILNYQINISDKQCKLQQFVKFTEIVVMNVFMSSSAQILVNVNDMLYSTVKGKYVDNVGIVKYVFMKKECHACNDVKMCKYFNSITDMDAVGCFVTFPVVEPHNEKVVGIIQTMFSAKLNEKNEMPKKNEMMLLRLIEKCFVNWIQRNQSEIKCLCVN